MVNRELMIPRVVEAKYTEGREARVVLEPMERGFGHTLGNALRRVLLSSIPGSAVTEVEIRGVEHEYDTLDGVREDVVDILLNLKGLSIRMFERAHAKVTLKKKGPGKVTAGDIELSHDIEIVNPEYVIATLSKDAELDMTLTIEQGRGYVPVPARRMDDRAHQIGMLLLDASFSPIRKVAYYVENTRVEQRTDLDKLVLELETNGTVEPEDVVREAATILSEQLSVLVGLEQGEVLHTTPAHPMEVAPVFKLPIDELDLGVRSANSLKQENIFFIGDLVGMTEDQLLRQTPNVGIKTVSEIKRALAQRELTLGMTLENWPPADLVRPRSGPPLF